MGFRQGGRGEKLTSTTDPISLASRSGADEDSPLSRPVGYLAGISGPPCARQFLICALTTLPESQDVTQWASDVTSVPPSFHYAPPGATGVATPVPGFAPLHIAAPSRSPAYGSVALDKLFGSLLGSAGERTNPLSSPPVEEGKD
ncbi:UNVERIFIED_CONTAM: hypothetical protein FKN15_053927 [Acipenser sinensis]